MTDELWENGLREVMTGTAGAARVMAPPTDAILRRGRSSVRKRNGLAGSGVLGIVAAAVIAGTSLGPAASGGTASAQRPVAAEAVVTMGPAAAKTKVVIYDDYRCPPCKQIDAGIGSTLQKETASGQVQVEYLPVNLVDRNSATSGTGSVVAGNAVQCAAERGDFYAYRAAVFAHQPQTQTAADDIFQSPAQLVAIAKSIPGLVTAEFVKCVNDLPYAAAIKRNYDAAIDTARCVGVPCISVDGQQWTNQDQGQRFDTWLMQKIAAS
jgi:protein-disulfide isomerase